MTPPLDPRRATETDRDQVIRVIAAAFERDPLWSWAMAVPGGGTAHHAELWAPFVDGALGHGWTWLAGPARAAAVWIPPGATEMTPAEEDRLEADAHRLLGDGAARYLDLCGRFEEAHPRHHPHYYLSLLGTDPAHRGQGLGMALVAHALALTDAEGVPAYLESSNPVNDERYARLGFEPVGRIVAPGGAFTVTTMWREARRPAPAGS